MQQIRNARPSLPIIIASVAAGMGALALANRARAKKALRENPPLGQFVVVGGACLHYVERGSGPTILLVHGNGVMARDWIISGLFDELAKTNRVIAVDRPGFGHSSRPRGIRWTPERQADALVELLERLDVQDAMVVGHSYGTLVAAALALNHPERIKAVALLGGYLYPNPRADVLLVAGSAVPVWGDVINHTLMPLLGEAMQKLINKKIFGPAEPTQAWRRQFSWAMALRPSRMRAGAADAVNMIPAAMRLSPRYGEMRMPVAILAGEGDRLVDTPTQSGRLHRALPDSRLTTFDGVGHMVHHNRTREIAQAVRAL